MERMMAAQMTVISITDRDVRVLKGSWPALTVCGRRDYDGNKDLSVRLKELAGLVKPNGSVCVLMISRKDVVLKILDFPSQHPAEIRRMLALQIPVIVPFDETQVIYRDRKIDFQEGGYTRSIAAVVQDQTIQTYIDAVSGAGWFVSDVYLGFDGYRNYITKELHPALSKIAMCAFVISGEWCSEILMIRQGKLIFSYYVPYGRKDSGSSSEDFVKMAAQILKTHEALQKEQIDYIFFDPFFRDLSGVKFSLMSGHRGTADVLQVFSTLPGALQSFIKKHQMDASWMPMLGCFIRGEEYAPMSFLPQRMSSSYLKRQRRRTLVSFLSALVMMIALCAAFFWVVMRKYDTRLLSLKGDIEALEPQLKALYAEESFYTLISRQDGDAHSVVDTVREIYRLIPQGISLQYFGMYRKGEFEIQGVAEEGQQVSQMQSAFVSSSHFQNVNLKYATKRKRFNREYTEFKLIFEQAER